MASVIAFVIAPTSVSAMAPAMTPASAICGARR
jgi:hypothetical protein